ncbi:MAG TPA: integron integrase [Gemmatimonadaceae bacterium]|nr:integron integrase [Gemmatimonadaceae bacterium]
MPASGGTNAAAPREPAPPRLLTRVRLELRVRHYSRRTEESYVAWIRRFIHFHRCRHPADMGTAEVAAFLRDLARERGLSASTQNQALASLMFLYRAVLAQPLAMPDGAMRAKAAQRVADVLTEAEVRSLFDQLEGTALLVAQLLYGAGLRLNEALDLRVGDVDVSRRVLLVRDGKGRKDRMTLLPARAVPALRTQLEHVRRRLEWDLSREIGRPPLPGGLESKYPSASLRYEWQFIFPATRTHHDPRTDRAIRYRLHESGIQRAVALAARRARIPKRVSCHVTAAFLRDAFIGDWV